MSPFLVHDSGYDGFFCSPTFHRDSEFCTIENCPIRHCVVGLGALETSYVLRTVKGITCREDPDLAPLKLYFQYVTQIEVSSADGLLESA